MNALLCAVLAQVLVTDSQARVAAQRLDAVVRDQTATVTLTVTLANPQNTVAEGIIVVPLPKGAAVSDFSMRVGDKTMEAELLDADKARRIYEEIVRKRKDPALLEIGDASALRARVFPIPARGSVDLTVRYGHRCAREGGLLRFQAPAFGRAAAKSTLRVEVESAEPLGAVYSPTHAVDLSRPDAHRARVTCESADATLPIFTLYAASAAPDIGVALATYRDAGDGHFMLVLSPPAEAKALPRDVVFVVDRSGSMAGEKMEQAKAALVGGIDRLAAGDAFAIVDFASDVSATGLMAAGADGRAAGRKRAEELRPAGSTNLSGALDAALRLLERREGRVAALVLITDGQPTVGEMEPDAILRAAKERNVAGARVFTFGVGGDVQTRLLDRLAEENGGLADVVQPGEKIDERTAKLLDRVGAPVLSGLRVEFDGVRVGDLQPQALPDLFKGGEVVVAGRYSGPGRCAVVLRGRAADGERAFRYDVNFPERDARDFEVARLWARRKVAWLLDQARLHGNPSKEVIDEIVSLSKTYRVATPFTSFLITEEGDAAAQRERVKEELLGLMRRATKVDADGLRALRESRLIMDAKR